MVEFTQIKNGATEEPGKRGHKKRLVVVARSEKLRCGWGRPEKDAPLLNNNTALLKKKKRRRGEKIDRTKGARKTNGKH